MARGRQVLIKRWKGIMWFFRDKRIVLGTLLLLFVAVRFWAGSRVPSLNEKALMGGDIQLNSLAFENVMTVSDDDPLLKRTFAFTVNWLETNRKGMTFGIIFAAILMTVLSAFRKKHFKSGVANSLMGIVIGAPLGVCVNCAAPIAKGLYSSGGRLEMTLAAMISSPTLNVIVLTILFSLFPIYIVLIKLGLTVAFIILVIPLLARYVGQDVLVCDLGGSCSLPLGIGSAGDEVMEDWWRSVVWLLKNLAKNFWYIVRTTVPLMFLAGFLGSLLITLIPWDVMASVLPSGSPVKILIAMGILALIGLFLPVPIAFDVLVAAILLASGMEVRYAMVLLFTLGIYSVYSFAIVWNTISKKMAVALSVVLLVLGVGAGVAGDQFFKWDKTKKNQMFFNSFGGQEEQPPMTVVRMGGAAEGKEPAPSQGELVASLREGALVADPVGTGTVEGISVGKVSFRDRVPGAATGFTRFEGAELGIDEPFSYSILSLITLSRFRGISAGDVHNDGWVDILLTSDTGVSLYANLQGDGFALQALEIPELEEFFVSNAALVDLDDDGWLDIIFAAYRKGLYTLRNEEGRFSGETLRAIPNHEDAVLTGAMAFGDLDRDGDLEIAVGNWSIGFIGVEGKTSLESSQNVLLVNESGTFEKTPLSGVTGETLVTLFTDFNNDGNLDLIVGNDFFASDLYYLGDGSGGLKAIKRGDGIIPHTGRSTMSISTADIDNDLLPEIYVGQISGMTGAGLLESRQVHPDICLELKDSELRAQCEEIMSVQWLMLSSIARRDVNKCFQLDERFQRDCVGINVVFWATRWYDEQEKCDLLPESWETLAFACNHRFSDRISYTKEELLQDVRQVANVNILLAPAGDGTFVDKAKELGLEVGGWTWNAKFADVDNDEWQDLFVANGGYFTRKRESNLFYRNQGGKGFVLSTEENGLESYLATSANTYMDMDNDGDLDIIMVPMVAPIVIYENNSTGGHSIAFELRDEVGNHFGIGSRVIIHYGPDGARHQMREIQSGGGYVSFDAPIAHFGLGEHEQVGRVEIQWSTGERTELEGDFEAGARYIVRRTS